MFGLSHHPTQTKFEVTKFEVTMSSKNFDMKCFWTWRIFQTLNAITNQWASISNNDDTYRSGALLTKSQEDLQTSLKFAKAQSGLNEETSKWLGRKKSLQTFVTWVPPWELQWVWKNSIKSNMIDSIEHGRVSSTSQHSDKKIQVSVPPHLEGRKDLDLFKVSRQSVANFTKFDHHHLIGLEQISKQSRPSHSTCLHQRSFTPCNYHVDAICQVVWRRT